MFVFYAAISEALTRCSRSRTFVRDPGHLRVARHLQHGHRVDEADDQPAIRRLLVIELKRGKDSHCGRFEKGEYRLETRTCIQHLGTESSRMDGMTKPSRGA